MTSYDYIIMAIVYFCMIPGTPGLSAKTGSHFRTLLLRYVML